MRTLLLCLALTLPAAAQRKLWTWTPPNQDAKVGHHIVRSASTASGLTAVIYLEADFNNLEEFQQAHLKWRAALVSSKGVTIAQTEIPAPAFAQEYKILETPGNLRWQVASVGKASITMTEGAILVSFRLTGKTGAITIMQAGDGEDFLAQEGGSPLPSFLKRSKAYAGRVQWEYDGPAGPGVATEFHRLASVELWSLK